MGATRDRYSRSAPKEGKSIEPARAGSEAARRLFAEADLIRRVLDSLPDIAHIYDHEWQWRHINPPAADWLRGLGHDPESLIGQRVWDVFPDHASSEPAQRAVREQREIVFELTTGGRVYETRVIPLPGGAVSLTRDITERKQAEEMVREQALRAQVLADATKALSEARLDLAAVIGTLAAQLSRVLGDLCMIRLREGSWLRSVAVAHTDPETEAFVRALVEAAPQRIDEGLAGRVAATGRPLLIPAADDATLALLKPEYRSYAERYGISSVLAVPLRIQDRVLGTLTLCRDRPGRPYTESDLRLVDDIADRAALAVENAHLHEAEREAREQAERLADRTAALQAATADLARALTPSEVIEVVMRHATAALGTFSAALLLATEDRAALEVVHSVGFDDRAISKFRTVPVSAALPAAVSFRSGEPELVPDPRAWLQRYPDSTEDGNLAGAKALAYLPLIATERDPLGVLALGFPTERSFAADQVDWLAALARLGAQALERARLFEAEARSRRNAEEANRVKSQFLGIMSHELRTPLNAVLGYADLLLAGAGPPLSEPQRAQIERIKQSALVQADLIDEVLEFARIEAGRVEDLRSVRLDVRDCVREVCDLVQPMAASKGITLRARLPDSPLELVTDARKLRQILLNLAGNAAKFTAEGEVEISVDAEGGCAIVSVRDTGPGVPPDKLEYIFEPFTQVDPSRTRQVGGIGLGLAISRRLARILGGDITVRSEVGSGSTFAVSIPIAIGEAE